MTVRRAVFALVALVRRRRLESELDGEIAAHLELAEREARGRGLSPAEARRQARLRFGGIAQIQEEHRDQRGIRWIETLLRDLRYGAAALVRAPGFTAIVVAVLALGIGANVAVFSIVNAVLLQPLPFHGPDRMVRVWEAPRAGVVNATSTPDFLDWQRLSGDVFTALAAEQPVSAAISGDGEPVRLPGKAVTSGYFQVFAAATALGRTFDLRDDQPGAAPVVVLSHATWQDHFGGDRGILDRRLILDGEACQVIGVLRPGGFDRDETKFWKPLVLKPSQQVREVHWLTVHGRLREGVSLDRARERMSAVHLAMADVTPTDSRDWKIVIEPLERWLVGNDLRQSIAVVFGAVALVLLIACANVASLLLAKGAARRKELAVRAALGAGRGRLVAQLLTESFVLCLLGGAAGAALGRLLIAAGTPLLRESLPFTADLSLDARVLAFAGLITLAVTLLAGTLPALQTSFGSLAECLNRSVRGSSGRYGRLRRAIVVGEVALSLVLVCGALLLFRSLVKLQQVDTGVRTENVITMSVDLPLGRYPTPQKAARLYQALAERIRSVPAVRQAALSTHLPMQWIGNGEGLKAPGMEKPVNVRYKRVDPGYFRTLGIPLLSGRTITGRDDESSRPIAVINQALAARLADPAGMRDPLGRTVRLTSPQYAAKGGSTTEVEIVGVIRSERVGPPGMPDIPVVYIPLAQNPSPRIRILAYTGAEPGSVMPGIRQAVREIDSTLALGDIATLEQVHGRTLSGVSRPAWLLGAFAAVALLLAAIGLYGVLSHLVTQQRREIGIRMALGARSRDVLTRILRNAMATVAAGLALGLPAAWALTRVLKNLLFGVSPLDPLALAVACAAMLAIGAIAGLVPAARAARLNPVTTLRDEG